MAPNTRRLLGTVCATREGVTAEMKRKETSKREMRSMIQTNKCIKIRAKKRKRYDWVFGRPGYWHQKINKWTNGMGETLSRVN
jgi:hypothetical protein